MDKQQNKTPLVRFPEFKDSWEHKQLNELLSVSKTKNTDLKYGKEDVLSVSGELGIVNQIEHLGRSYAGVSVHNYGVVELNQIVYTKSPLKANPYGIIKLNKHKAGIVSTLYAVYNVNKKTEGQFIEHYFSLNQNLNRYLRPLVRKGAKNTLQVTDEEAIQGKFAFPQLKEQKKIAHFFTTIDQKLNQLQEKKNALEQYKKGMMQQIFSQQLRFKDDNGKDFPDWENIELGEILDYEQPTKYIVESKEYDNCYKTPVLTAGKSFILGYTNEKEGIFQNKLPVIIFDDFTTATQFVDFEFKVKSSAMKILVGKDKVNMKFVYEIMQGINFPIGAHGRHWISVYSNLPIKYPCKAEQTKIANFLSKIDEKIENVNQQIAKTKEWKKGLLQKMFVN